jgi:electron transfer flavoprotein beta subunit
LSLADNYRQEKKEMLNIIVCVKVVMDPEAPVSTFKIDPEERRVFPAQGIPPVVNPYDENCLEAALRIKEGQPARITAISTGKTIPKAVVRKCLAVGVDDLVLLEDDLFKDIDSFTTSRILTAAIRKLGAYDLILTGRMSADVNAGQVGPGIAELLGIPGITVVRKIDIINGVAKMERVLINGREIIECALPCLVSVSHEIGELRSANIKGLMAAQKQPFTSWNAEDLNIDTSSLRRSRPLKLYKPEREVICEIVAGDTPEEAAENLAVKLSQII